ncbi:MAG: GAF domain-containing sensor histidine kinase [Anaerolineae bacterium]|nr:GAF domain-containing sensor histidine kinase [Anaerolineae bacterium]
MNTKVLKWVTVILPVLFWALIMILRNSLFSGKGFLPIDLVILLIVTVGVIAFSNWVFRIVDNREREINERKEQLEALHSAALTLTTELDLGEVLQKVVELSRGLVKAKYGALGVLEEGTEYIAQFFTSGISKEQRELLGEIPRGHGLLGLLIREGKSIRISSIHDHKDSAGFPPNHPEMHTLLGVPIKSAGKIIGNLYMCDKITVNSSGQEGNEDFTKRNQEVLEMFATQAAIAIENAQLYRKAQRLSVLEERERFAMDMHDGIIQSIFGTGLILENAQLSIKSNPEGAESQIGEAMQALNDVNRDIRNYILGLRPNRFQGRDLIAGLEELMRDLRANSFLTVNLHQSGDDYSSLAPEQTVQILHIAQEGLNNIRKHARAVKVNIRLEHKDGNFLLVIEDDGIGFDPKLTVPDETRGIKNMHERAKSLNGKLQIKSKKGGKTRISLLMPFN